MNVGKGVSLTETRMFKDTEIRKDFAFRLSARNCIKGAFVIGGKFKYEGLEKHKEKNNLRKSIYLFKKIRYSNFVL